MALTTPKGFSGGPMADIDYGQASSASAWVETAGAGLVVSQPSTGTRTVSIAAGQCDAFGIRVINDAALTQALTAPGSGGAWYLIAIRRDWSLKTTSLQALAGPTTGGTTTPTAIPTALPATYQNAPGTQFDQPLAWVWASSATTTLTLFDLRLTENGTRGLQAVNFWALVVANMTVLRDGAIVSVASHTTASGGLHFRSTWQRVGGAGSGQLSPIGRIAVNESAGSVRADLTAIFNGGYAPGVTPFAFDSELIDGNTGITYRWSPDYTSNVPDWKPWDSTWRTPAGGYFSATGWTINYTLARWRYRGGKVLMEFAGTITATGGGFDSITLPVQAATGAGLTGSLHAVNTGGGFLDMLWGLLDLNTIAPFYVYVASFAGPQTSRFSSGVTSTNLNATVTGSIEYTPQGGI